jgi:hypothetical protein
LRRRAGNGTRTRDPNLGKVVLYQLSYSRNMVLGSRFSVLSSRFSVLNSRFPIFASRLTLHVFRFTPHVRSWVANLNKNWIFKSMRARKNGGGQGPCRVKASIYLLFISTRTVLQQHYSPHGVAVSKFNFNAEIPENIQVERNISAPHENSEND